MTTKRFLRRGWYRYSRIGKNKKKKQKWKNPSGIHNKLRKKRRGYQDSVAIGFRTPKSIRGGKYEGKIVRVDNLKDIKGISGKNVVVLGRMGKKKRLEIAKELKEKKISVMNYGIGKLLREQKKKTKKVEEKK